MADQPPTPSGSRWEPDPDETPTSEAPVTEPAAPDAPIPASAGDPAAAEHRARLRGRVILAGAATALTLGAGLIGFVIGHSTNGDDAGFVPAGNFQRDGSGQHGPPSFPGGRQDGDRDGDDFGPPQGFDDGSSSGSTDGTGT
jgi:hypothetical protein